MWNVGAKVRVCSKDRTSSGVAIISLINEESFDIIFDASNEEECNVLASRMMPLEDFEEEESLDEESNPMKLKEYGNILFRHKDFDSAMQIYAKALKVIGKNNRSSRIFSVGSSVLVTTKGTLLIRPGIVSGDEVESRRDIMYEECGADGDGQAKSLPTEDEAVSVSRLFSLGEMRHRDCQRACYLNMARCAMKKQLHGWAVKYASLALAVAEMLGEEYVSTQSVCLGTGTTEMWKKQAADCIYLRAKSLVSAGRPGTAVGEARLLHALDPDRGSSMMREIGLFKQQRRKSNKELAKAVVTWVSETMSSSETNEQDDLFLQDLENGVENEDNDHDASQVSLRYSSLRPPCPESRHDGEGERDMRSDHEEEKGKGGWFSGWL